MPPPLPVLNVSGQSVVTMTSADTNADGHDVVTVPLPNGTSSINYTVINTATNDVIMSSYMIDSVSATSALVLQLPYGTSTIQGWLTIASDTTTQYTFSQDVVCGRPPPPPSPPPPHPSPPSPSSPPPESPMPPSPPLPLSPGYFDECPDADWFRLDEVGPEKSAKCYRIMRHDDVSFYEANQLCSQMTAAGDARLASFGTQDERDRVNQQLASHAINGSEFWWINADDHWDMSYYVLQQGSPDSVYCTIGDRQRGLHATKDSFSNSIIAQGCENMDQTKGGICEVTVRRRSPPPPPPPLPPPSPMPPPLQEMTVSLSNTVAIDAARTGKVTCLRPADMEDPPPFVDRVELLHASTPATSAFKDRVSYAYPDPSIGRFVNFTDDAYCVFDAPGSYDLKMRLHFSEMINGTNYLDLRFLVNLRDMPEIPYDLSMGDDRSEESLVMFNGCRWDVYNQKCDTAYLAGASGYASLVQRKNPDHSDPGIGCAAAPAGVQQPAGSSRCSRSKRTW
ncbi:hypothetical protein CYMTET_54352 [Cymbomonas tetramitiformis]|uniref:C-type lectin domain-containing protein n=1 Tax=Cymbomonas tetramitiformis TaxID=36881 RepID=A0AAE0BGK5_9CHLO|nr:hypothetical protein CYMTET_54352 [Cymbomonas tetramitiformis]